MKQVNKAVGRTHLLTSLLVANPQGITLHRIHELYAVEGFTVDLNTVRRDVRNLDAADFEIEHHKGTGTVRLAKESIKRAKTSSALRTDKAEQICLELVIRMLENEGIFREAALLNCTHNRLFSSRTTSHSVDENYADNLEELFFAIDEKSLVRISFNNGEPSQTVRPVNLELSKSGSIILETSKQQFFALALICSVEIIEHPGDTIIVTFPESFSQAA